MNVSAMQATRAEFVTNPNAILTVVCKGIALLQTPVSATLDGKVATLSLYATSLTRSYKIITA
jgi:hypothetical protein